MKNSNTYTCIATPKPASPLELILGWYDFFATLYFITLIASSFSIYRTDDDLSLTVLACALGIGLLWLPGILIGIIAPYAVKYLDPSARSIFDGGLVQAFERCRAIPINSDSGLCLVITMMLSAFIVMGDVLSLFILDAWASAVIAGVILSIVGFAIISLYLAHAIITEVENRRQLL